jgi:hypothetical protein
MTDAESQKPEAEGKSNEPAGPKEAGPKDGAAQPPTETPSPEDYRKTVQGAAGSEWGELLHSLAIALSGSRVQSGGVSLLGTNIVFGGEFVGGDRSAGVAATTTLAAKRVDDEELTVIREAYLELPVCADARTTLEGRSVVVLHGPAGIGKCAAGLRLLGRWESSAIWRLDARVETISQLLTFEYDERCGYLVDTLAWDAADRLNPSFLERLGGRLRERSSGLVLTVDGRVKLDTAGLRKYVVPWPEAPERRSLLELLLGWHLRHEPDLDPASALNDERVVALIRGPLAVAQVAVFAELLADVVRGRLVIEHALDRMEAGAGEIKKWFAEHQSLADYTFMVAAAVLSGASYQAVVQAADRLAAAFGARVPSDENAIAKRVLANGRSRRLGEVGAQTPSGYEQLPFGLGAPVEILELTSETRRQAVVRHVWYEHDLARPAMTKWLEELGHHHSLEVRARAARTVGDLMQSEFGLLLGDIVLPWAHNDDLLPGLAAALALGVCANSATGAPVVRDLMAKWIDREDEEDWQLRWTAAAAYGYLGLNDPTVALRALEELLRSEERRLLSIIGRSLATLFEAGSEAPAFYRAVLELLHRCSTTWDGEPTILGSLSVFLDVAERSEIPQERIGFRGPTVLWLMTGDADPASSDVAVGVPVEDNHREAAGRLAFELWQRALSRSEMQPWALEVLKGWVRRADYDDALFQVLEGFVHRLAAQSERERGRIVSWLLRWNESVKRPRRPTRSPAQAVERPSDAARRLHESLMARSET